MTLPEIIKDYLALWIALGGVLGTLVLALMQRTYAKREDVTRITERLAALEHHVADIPAQEEWHELSLRMEKLNGQIEAVKPSLARLERLADLLLENELLEGKRKS